LIEEERIIGGFILQIANVKLSISFLQTHAYYISSEEEQLYND